MAWQRWTRRSENDNTPQPIDQRMGRPLMDPQVGYCNSFALTHYLATVFAVAQGCIVVSTLYMYRTHIPVVPPIPEIWLFVNLTLKSPRSRVRSRSHGGSDFLSTHIPFIPCPSILPFLGCGFFKIWPWKFKVKVMREVKVQSHKVCPTSFWFTPLLFQVNRVSYSCDTIFANIWPWKVQGHKSMMLHTTIWLDNCLELQIVLSYTWVRCPVFSDHEVQCPIQTKVFFFFFFWGGGDFFSGVGWNKLFWGEMFARDIPIIRLRSI